MKHMVGAVKMLGLFNGRDIGRLFHDADQALVARRTAAVNTRVHVRDVVAERAQPQIGLDVVDRTGESLRIFIARAQDVEGETLRALAANAGQLLQFVNQPGHGLSELGHRIESVAFRVRPTCKASEKPGLRQPAATGCL